jgi:hypothetical protein
MVTIAADDLMNRREWDDSIGYGSFFIDIHNPAGPGMGGQTWRPPKGFYYQIPYHALLPETVDNLLVAGRCVSADHVALGSLRIMATCTVMGEASGTAAVLSLHEEVSPRELQPALLGRQLKKQNAIIDENGIVRFSPEDDPGRSKNTPILRQQVEKTMKTNEVS